MFLSDQYNDAITIYSLFENTDTEERRMHRKVIRNAFWRPSTQGIDHRHGTPVDAGVELNIPFTMDYIPQRIWQDREPLNGEWTVLVGADQEPSRILQGEINYEFMPASNEDFYSLYLKPFNEYYQGKIFLARKVDEYLFGPQSMWRITVTMHGN